MNPSVASKMTRDKKRDNPDIDLFDGKIIQSVVITGGGDPIAAALVTSVTLAVSVALATPAPTLHAASAPEDPGLVPVACGIAAGGMTGPRRSLGSEISPDFRLTTNASGGFGRRGDAASLSSSCRSASKVAGETKQVQ